MNRWTWIMTVVTLGAAVHGAAAAGDHPVEPIARHKTSAAVAGAWDQGDERFQVIVHLRRTIGDSGILLSHELSPENRRRHVSAHVLSATRTIEKQTEDAKLDITSRFQLQEAFAATVDRKALAALLDSPEVHFVQEDGRWPLHTAEGMQVIKADALHTWGITGDGTAVAIIDTGVDALHPSLGGGMIPNAKVVYGLDTADGDDDPKDCSGHGTAVASVAAGASYQWNPHLGFAGGVAPEAKILAYKASRDAECSSLIESAVVAAIEDAILKRQGDGYELAAINISAGTGAFTGPCDSVESAYSNAVDAAIAAGIAVVASSGNEGMNDAITAPACLSNAISVGSVWDSDAGNVGFSFCLDAECTTTCNDSFSPALSEACYSNSSRYLNLLAPSEYLQVAHAGGQVLDFGGTSGAAPYVTGAVALLRDAFPDLDPVHARLLLSLTGRDVVTGGDNVTKPLVNLEAALDLQGVAIGDTCNVAIPTAGGSLLSSTARVAEDGRIASIEVLLDVVHPNPQQLLITLSSPDGTTVTLHKFQPGTTLQSNDLNRFEGIYALYPDPDTPAESLDAFFDAPMRGEWTLKVKSTAGRDVVSSQPRLVGWAMRFEAMVPPSPPPGHSFFLPVAARVDGANDTSWVSDIRLFNPSPLNVADVRIYLVEAGQDGTRRFDQRDLTVPPRSVASLPDFIARRFSSEEFQGHVIFQTESRSLVATSRIFNTGSDMGTYGQYVGTTAHEDAVAAGDPPLTLIHLSGTEAFRSNIGFSEITGHAVTVEVALFDGDTGAGVGTIGEYAVEPFSNAQINRVLEMLHAGRRHNAYAQISVIDGDGMVTAYASVVDNNTGDAIFIPGSQPTMATSWVVPVVAKLKGDAGTDWVSDLRLFNPGVGAAQLTFQFRPRRGAGDLVMQRSVSVPAGQVLAADDILGTLFRASSTSGSIHVTPASAETELIISSRTYNRTDAGSFGQFIPAVDRGVATEAAVIHLDEDADFRTNFGLCEVSGKSVVLTYSLRDHNGAQLGEERSLFLGPYELVQINDVFAQVEALPTGNCYMEVARVSGEGTFHAYASVVDEISGDAIFVPGQAIAPE